MEINNEITIQLATYTSLDLEMFLIVLGYLLTFEIWQVLIPPSPFFFGGGGGNVLTIFLEIVWPLFDRVTTIEYWPSGSRRRVSPSFSSATSKALLRLYRALDFCSLSYWIKSGLKSNTRKHFRMFNSILCFITCCSAGKLDKWILKINFEKKQRKQSRMNF